MPNVHPSRKKTRLRRIKRYNKKWLSSENMANQMKTKPPLRDRWRRLVWVLVAILAAVQGQGQMRLLPANGVYARGAIESDTLRVMYGDTYVTTWVKDSLLGGHADHISASGPDVFVAGLVAGFCKDRKFRYSVMIQRYIYSQGQLREREIHRYEIGVLDLNETGCELEIQGHRLQIWMSLYGYGQLGMATTLYNYSEPHMRDFFEAFQKVMRRAPRMKGWPYSANPDNM